MKKRFRSPAVLLVAFAMIVVTAGVVYAHWTSTSRIEANINTGSMEIGWEAWGTNDDGDPGNDPTGTDDPGIIGEWNSGNGTSLDPSWYGPPWDRYTKNVASCGADGGGDTLNVYLDNAYPSYYCSVFARAYNHGSVPAKATALSLEAEHGYYECSYHLSEDDANAGINEVLIVDFDGDRYVDFDGDGIVDGTEPRERHDEFGPFADANHNDEFDAGDTRLYNNCWWVSEGALAATPTGHPGEFLFGEDFTLHIERGIECGDQVDPGGDGTEVEGWIHVENDAEQGAQYRVVLTQNWVNWNEWDDGMCAP